MADGGRESGQGRTWLLRVPAIRHQLYAISSFGFQHQMPRRQRIVRGAGETPFASRSAETGETVGGLGEGGRAPLSAWAPWAGAPCDEAPVGESPVMAAATAGGPVSDRASSG